MSMLDLVCSAFEPAVSPGCNQMDAFNARLQEKGEAILRIEDHCETRNQDKIKS